MRALWALVRVTRRDTLRHPLASLIAVLAVAVPTALVSYFLIREESRTTAYELNLAPVTATYIGGQCRQSPDGYSHECTDGADDRPQQEILLDALPHGFNASPVITGLATLESPTAARETSLTQVDPAVPQTPTPGEIRLPSSLREQLGVVRGETVTLTTGEATAEVTVAADTPGHDVLLAHPTVSDPATFRTSRTLEVVWQLAGDRLLTWDDVGRLNAVGFTVQGRDILGTPPPPVAGPEGPPGVVVDQPLQFLWVIIAFIAGTVVALAVIQLLSPVFAVPVNRQSRTYALMSAQGAAPRHIIWAALAYGTLAGLPGATGGVLIGGASALVLWPRQYPDWPILVPWPALSTLWAFAVAASTAAALLPAWVASRADAVNGASPAVSGGAVGSRRWTWIGPGLLVVSVVLLGISLLPPPPPNHEDLNWASLASAFGGLIGFIGVVFTAPAVVRLIGHRVRRPLPARLAARDMLRRPLRSMPAAAAVAALVTLSTFSMVQSEAFDTRASAWERQTWSPGVIVVPDSPRREETIKAVSDVVGPVAREDVHGISQGRWSYRSHAFLVATPGLVEPCHPGEPCGPPAWVPGPQELFGAFVVIASPLLLDALSVPTAMPSGAAMLVSADVEVEEAGFQLHRATGEPPGEPVGDKVDLRISPILPETVTDWMPTPEAFERLGVESEFLGEILIAERPVTPAMRSELTAVEPNIRMPGVPFQRGPDAEFYDTGIVVLTVVLTVAVALLPSAGRTRRRNALLEATGAPPHLPRAVTAAAGALIALAGALPGLIAGHVGALFTSPSFAPYVGVNWWLTLGLTVIAPVAAATIGWAAVPRTTLPDDLRS